MAVHGARVIVDAQDRQAWLLLALWVPLTAMYAGMGRMQRWRLGLLRRLVQRGSELAD